jgi:hypothetical protein
MGWNNTLTIRDKSGNRRYIRAHPKPGRGVRLGIRRRKERERRAAELKRLEIQAEKNWNWPVNKLVVSATRTRDEQPPKKAAQPPPEEKVPPTDLVGQTLYLALRLGTIFRSDSVTTAQWFAVKQAMLDISIVIPTDHHFSTFGGLYDWLKQDHQANQDPNWLGLKRELARHGLEKAQRKDAMPWHMMRTCVCLWAWNTHSVSMWESEFGSQYMTYADAISVVLEMKNQMR